MSENNLEKPIDKAAAYYVDQIRTAFPVGPYSLIGYSSGGIMALEMARRFGELNCNVPFLAMIDTIFPFSSESQLPRSGKVFSPFFLKNLPNWLYYFLPYWMSYYVRLARNKNFRSYYKEAQNKNLAVRSWLKHYRPEPYSGRVVFYRAKAQGLFTASSHKGWENICSALDIYTVPGSHNTIMYKPHVRYLAEKIASELRKSISLLPDICRKVKTGPAY
jgi:thioesterase domain-containing protein